MTSRRRHELLSDELLLDVAGQAFAPRSRTLIIYNPLFELDRPRLVGYTTQC